VSVNPVDWSGSLSRIAKDKSWVVALRNCELKLEEKRSRDWSLSSRKIKFLSARSTEPINRMYQIYSKVHWYVLRLLLGYRRSGLQLNLLLPAEQQMQMCTKATTELQRIWSSTESSVPRRAANANAKSAYMLVLY
jgi:hypothetical protein